MHLDVVGSLVHLGQSRGTNMYDLKILTTNKCNRNCYYCFEKFENRLADKIDTKVISDISAYIKRNLKEILTVDLMGGETYLQTDNLIEILDGISSGLSGSNRPVVLYTNGTIFNDDIIKMYNKFKHLNLQIYLTDHGLDLQNKFSTVYKHVCFLKENNIKFDIRVILDKYHIYNFHLIKEYFDNTIDDIYMVMAYFDNTNPVTKEDFDQLKKYIDANYIFFDDRLKQKILYDFEIINLISNRKFDVYPKCGAGVDEITLDTNGNIMGCENFLTASDLETIYIGDVDNLADARNKNSQLKWLNERYLNPPKKCTECPYTIICSQCRYNYTLNTDVYSEKPVEICNFSELYYNFIFEIGEIILNKLINNEVETSLSVYREIFRLQKEVMKCLD